MTVTDEARSRDSTPAPPPFVHYVTEPSRTMVRLGLLPAAAPWLARAPRGDGHPVLVLPGLLATDSSTAFLRRYLHGLGHEVHRWRLGRNLGPTRRVLDGLQQSVTVLSERAGQPISLVGWSLGGIFARELGRRHPELVRRVVTLGSPFALTDPRQTRADGAYRRQSRRHDPARALDFEALRQPIPVPSTALFSRRDGIAAWPACIGVESEQHENIEVRCPHLGFGTDPATLWAVADRLAQPAGVQQTFRPPRWLTPLYPRG